MLETIKESGELDSYPWFQGDIKQTLNRAGQQLIHWMELVLSLVQPAAKKHAVHHQMKNLVYLIPVPGKFFTPWHQQCAVDGRRILHPPRGSPDH